jgi:hypothetical protein
MKQVAAILTSIWSLFVDDALFAALIVAWMTLTYLLALSGFESVWRGALLLGGLGLILMHGAWRKTRSR